MICDLPITGSYLHDCQQFVRCRASTSVQS